MSRIPEDELLRRIEKGVSQLTPDRAEEIWDCPAAAADGSEWYLDCKTVKIRKNKKRRFIRTLAACFALCIISAFLFQSMPSASVYLDVNPSVELKVNYRNRVTSAVPCNHDAEEILENMDLKDTDLDVALYAILGSMVHHGYLTEARDTILVSVRSANAGRALELEHEVTGIVTESLDKIIRAGEVLSQQIDESDVERTDDDYRGTPGKSALVDSLEDKYPQLKKENLDELTIDEIVSHLNQEGLDYSEYQEDDDDDDDEYEYDDDDDDDDDDCDDGFDEDDDD